MILQKPQCTLLIALHGTIPFLSLDPGDPIYQTRVGLEHDMLGKWSADL
jgi:hypothetical protein